MGRVQVQCDEVLEAGYPDAGRWVEVLKQAAEAALTHSRAPEESELTLVLSENRQLQALNRQFLGIDAPTDVLSFPAGDLDPESGATYLGDVVISIERATEQAAAGGHSLAAELQLLTVHGVLHLLGHDHAGPEEKAAMWSAQAAILNGLGIDLNPP